MAITIPLSTADTRPVELIAAWPVPLNIDHVTLLSVALAGNTAALSCRVPLSMVMVADPPAPVTVRPVTGTIWLELVIIKVPLIPEPSLAVALAVTVPLSTAVTRPAAVIVAWPVPLTNDQVTVLSVALDGNTAAISCRVPLSVVMVADPPAPVTVRPVTGTIWLELVIIKVPLTPDPSLAVALAVTCLLYTSVTRPAAVIVAWPVPLTNDHVTVLSVALDGNTAALSCRVPLSVVMVADPPAPVTVMPVTGTIWLELVIIKVPLTPEPSLAVALAVTVPLSTAVTRPAAVIVAWPVPLTNDHVTVLSVALDGNTAALSCRVLSLIHI